METPVSRNSHRDVIEQRQIITRSVSKTAKESPVIFTGNQSQVSELSFGLLEDEADTKLYTDVINDKIDQLSLRIESLENIINSFSENLDRKIRNQNTRSVSTQTDLTTRIFHYQEDKHSKEKLDPAQRDLSISNQSEMTKKTKTATNQPESTGNLGSKSNNNKEGEKKSKKSKNDVISKNIMQPNDVLMYPNTSSREKGMYSNTSSREKLQENKTLQNTCKKRRKSSLQHNSKPFFQQGKKSQPRTMPLQETKMWAFTKI